MDTKEMPTSQLRGKLSSIKRICRNECDYECNGICPVASQERDIREELNKRKAVQYCE